MALIKGKAHFSQLPMLVTSMTKWVCKMAHNFHGNKKKTTAIYLKSWKHKQKHCKINKTTTLQLKSWKRTQSHGKIKNTHDKIKRTHSGK